MSKEGKSEMHEMVVHFKNADSERMNPANRELPKSFLDLTALIRSIQRHDGHKPCFRTGLRECGVTDCTWRSHCIDDQNYKSEGYEG